MTERVNKERIYITLSPDNITWLKETQPERGISKYIDSLVTREREKKMET